MRFCNFNVNVILVPFGCVFPFDICLLRVAKPQIFVQLGMNIMLLEAAALSGTK
jgi:hypothetical protein